MYGFVSILPVASSVHQGQFTCAQVKGFQGRAARLQAARLPRSSQLPSVGASSLRMFEISDGEPYPLNPAVIFIAVLGWSAAAAVPSNIPVLGGTGLTQAFLASIQRLLAQYPTGPKLDDPFWFYLIVYHVGLFALLIFGQIGYAGYAKGTYTRSG
jgi:photosystem I subunit PsaO